VLRRILPQNGEGWLSEESVDDRTRLDCHRVWVVDPIDGTREFIQGIPEWCISIGLLEGGVPVAGGIFNPATGELVLGSLEDGVTLNGEPVRVTEPKLAGFEPVDSRTGGVDSRTGGAVVSEAHGPGTSEAGEARISVLASRSEIRRGEWDRFEGGRFDVRPCGSVAYKLGLVAAGRADATWTLVGKSEWDVVGGTALVRAAGGTVCLRDGSEPTFNQPEPVYPNYVAAGTSVARAATEVWLT
jgi:myo-inositol-1(or 4)-monophosphatase